MLSDLKEIVRSSNVSVRQSKNISTVSVIFIEILRLIAGL